MLVNASSDFIQLPWANPYVWNTIHSFFINPDADSSGYLLILESSEKAEGERTSFDGLFEQDT